MVVVMNGRDLVLLLAHLFRATGRRVDIDRAIEFLSFDCRYGLPSTIRRVLTVALQKEMIRRLDGEIEAAFLYDKQDLTPIEMAKIAGRLRVDASTEPIH